MHCEICKRTDHVHVYILDPEYHLVALCVVYDPVFWTNPPSYFEEPSAFIIATEAEEHYTRYLPYKTARDAFVQTYDPSLTCLRRTRNDSCTEQVAMYYFSSGETIPLCTNCAQRRDRFACMWDGDHPISYEYYHAVYNLRF